MNTPLQYFSTRRLPAWQGELEFLQRSLMHEPDAVQAWWWKLRMRVLAFVIARYGTDVPVRAQDYAPEPHETSGDLMFGERRTVEPRPREALGAHLRSIAKENDFPRSPALPDKDDQGQRKRHEKVLAFAVGVIAFCYTVITLGLAIEAGGKDLVFTLLLFGVWVLFLISDPLLKLIGRWLKEK
jgi:hypothetical protein